MNGPQIVFSFTFLGEVIPVSQTVVTTWFIMLLLTIFSVVMGRKLKKEPTKRQAIAELIVDAIYKLTEDTMGKKFIKFAPYIGTILIFIGVCNISGLFGFRPPTADLNTTMALALMTFIIVHTTGIKMKGIGGYLKGFLEPMPFLLPLNILGEISTPISLSFRLFGNMVGGLIIMGLVYQMMSFVAVIPIPAVLHMYFDLFAGLLQSFIFTMLTMVFISLAGD